LNDLLKYNVNTNKATKGKGTMLTQPLDLEQFNQGVNKKLVQFHPRWLKGSYETNKGTRNELQTTPK
jgi:hypothetical protein